jgi:hypothetical protein
VEVKKLTTNSPKIIQRWRKSAGIAAVSRMSRSLISYGVSARESCLESTFAVAGCEI